MGGVPPFSLKPFKSIIWTVGLSLILRFARYDWMVNNRKLDEICPVDMSEKQVEEGVDLWLEAHHSDVHFIVLQMQLSIHRMIPSLA